MRRHQPLRRSQRGAPVRSIALPSADGVAGIACQANSGQASPKVAPGEEIAAHNSIWARKYENVARVLPARCESSVAQQLFRDDNEFELSRRSLRVGARAGARSDCDSGPLTDGARATLRGCEESACAAGTIRTEVPREVRPRAHRSPAPPENEPSSPFARIEKRSS